MNRRLTTLLDRLHPDLNMEMKLKQSKQIDSDADKRLRTFEKEDPVYIKNYTEGAPWIPAKIVETTGPVSYKAQSLTSGEISRRHVDQIRSRVPDEQSTVPPDLPPDGNLSVSDTPPESSPPPSDSPVLRRSQRVRRAPGYLDDFVLQS